LSKLKGKNQSLKWYFQRLQRWEKSFFLIQHVGKNGSNEHRVYTKFERESTPFFFNLA